MQKNRYKWVCRLSLVLDVTNRPVGRMAHAEDCKSFYIGSIPVPASKTFRLSSAVEQSAVNRLVVGSNPTVGANKKSHPLRVVFLLLPDGEMRANEKLPEEKNISGGDIFNDGRSFPASKEAFKASKRADGNE